MSFASDARGELAREKVEQPCCARAEVAAALLFGGGVAYIGREKYRLRIQHSEKTLHKITFFQ